MLPSTHFRNSSTCPIRSLILFALITVFASALSAQFEPTPAWPLCGDFYKSDSVYFTYTGADWMALQPDCPLARRGSTYSDELQVPYGPRHLRAALEYDWHRGIDIPTRREPADTNYHMQRPVFAIAAGTVIVCEKTNPDADLPGEPALIPCTDPRNVHADFRDIRLLIQHERPTYGMTTPCEPDGCYFSRYTHLSTVRADLENPGGGVSVIEGKFLGITGYPDGTTPTPFNHLHFEIRSAIDDQPDMTQREAINPLIVLPYDDSALGACVDDPSMTCDDTMEVAFEVPAVDLDGDGIDDYPLGLSAIDAASIPQPVVTVTVKASLPPASDESDLDRIEVRVSELVAAPGGGSQLVEITQGSSSTTTTPENEDWVLDPPFLDFQLFNRQYTYKHETTFIPSSNQDQILYSVFLNGSHESPFTGDTGFPMAWSGDVPDYHLTATEMGSTQIGEFNGLKIWPARFNSKNSQQVVYTQTQELAATTASQCIEAFAYDIQGHRGQVPATSGPCAPVAPANGDILQTIFGVALQWDSVVEAGFYRVWYYNKKTNIEPARESLIYEGSSTSRSLGRPTADAAWAVEACYASAPSCAGTGGACPTIQCSGLTAID